MFKQLGHRKRFQILGIGLILAPFVLYWVALSDTIGAYRSCINLKAQQSQIRNIDERLDEARNELAEISFSIGMVDGDPAAFQTEVMSAVSGFCSGKDIDLVDFPAVQTYTESGMTLETISFTIEGGFISTVKLINHLETEAKVGRLISTEFHKTRTKRSKRKVLRTTIHVQNVRKEV